MKRSISTAILFIAFLYLVSCRTDEPLDEKIIGIWDIDKVFEAEDDVTAEHNPESNRWISFSEDGQFESGGDPYGPNSGSWEVDNENGVLYIDSDVEGDDSEWNISINNNEFIWNGIGTPRQENFKLILKRRK